MKHLTIRDVPRDLSQALDKERRRRKASLTQTVKDLLAERLGLGAKEPWRNGLEKFAGQWTAEEFEEFERATAVFEKIDEEMWR